MAGKWIPQILRGSVRRTLLSGGLGTGNIKAPITITYIIISHMIIYCFYYCHYQLIAIIRAAIITTIPLKRTQKGLMLPGQCSTVAVGMRTLERQISEARLLRDYVEVLAKGTPRDRGNTWQLQMVYRGLNKGFQVYHVENL